MDAQLPLNFNSLWMWNSSFTTMSDELLSDQPLILTSYVHSLWFINHLDLFILRLSLKVFHRFVNRSRLNKWESVSALCWTTVIYQWVNEHPKGLGPKMSDWLTLTPLDCLLTLVSVLSNQVSIKPVFFFLKIVGYDLISFLWKRKQTTVFDHTQSIQFSKFLLNA